MQKAGDWLQIGGATNNGWGTGRLEVRVATDDMVGWTWRAVTDEERRRLIALWNLNTRGVNEQRTESK